MTREEKMQIVINNYFKWECNIDTTVRQAFEKGFRIGVEKALALQEKPRWIPLHFDGMTCDFPYEMDGHWVIVTDGKNISVERIKKDAYDHFYPTGRWFALEDVKAWMPLPTSYKGEE